jgi:hypothetical protein
VQLPSGDAHSKLEPGKVEHKTNSLLELGTRNEENPRVVQTSELMIDCYSGEGRQRKVEVCVRLYMLLPDAALNKKMKVDIIQVQVHLFRLGNLSSTITQHNFLSYQMKSINRSLVSYYQLVKYTPNSKNQKENVENNQSSTG